MEKCSRAVSEPRSRVSDPEWDRRGRLVQDTQQEWGRKPVLEMAYI